MIVNNIAIAMCEDSTVERLNTHELMGCVEKRKTDKWKTESKDEKLRIKFS
jgi:hypothetical protein